MKQHDVNKLIEQRLTAEYAGVVSPILRGNAPTQRTLPTGTYARMFIDPISASNVFLGATKTRVTGMIIIELFLPLGAGDRLGVQQAEEFNTIFNNQAFSGISCFAGIINVVGAKALEGEDMRRYKITCSIPFYFDRT